MNHTRRQCTGGRELEPHRSESSGKTFSNFTLCLGTAIIPATASAHFAVHNAAFACAPGGVRCAIDLHQHEPGGIVVLL